MTPSAEAQETVQESKETPKETSSSPVTSPVAGPVAGPAEWEEALKQRVIVGDFAGAVEVCFRYERFADALVIATWGGAELAEQTADGLQTYGILDPADRENLTRLASLARSLETISRKELRNERLSDEEYDLIREYGGTLEHFWIEAVKDRTDAEYLDAREIPASLVTDIATDPNGTVLQAANGRPAQIYVIVPVDGTLRIASGVVYNFYQFCQPLSARLTDTEWRQMIGEWMSPDGRFHQDETPEKPGWTQSYWVQG